MSADIRLNSRDVCVSNIHDISLKGLQVLHLQDIFVRLTIAILHLQGNHFLSCQKIYRAVKNLHPNVPPIWGSFITNSFPNPFLSSSPVVTSWTRWTHGPIQKQPRNSRAQRLWAENARPNHCCNIHPGWDDPKIFCQEQRSGSNCWTKGHVWWIFEWFLVNVGNFSTENPRSQGFWRKLKHSPVETWIWTSWWHHVYLLKRAWWTTLRFCWSIFLLNDAGKLLS